jgi:peptidyl-prolyl cis-trans isomerase SurA
MKIGWKNWFLSMWLCLLVGLVSTLTPSRAEVVDRIIAYVNDDIITLSELNERTNAFVAARRQNPFLQEEEQSLEKIRRDMLDLLINERLAAQEISRLKITVSDKELDETIGRIKQENHLTQEGLEAELRKEGKTVEDLREQIKRSMEQTTLVNREVRDKTVITDEMIQAYYKDHIEEFESRTRFRIQDIYLPFTPTDTPEDRTYLRNVAKHILELLRQEGDFSSLAKRYSQGLGAEAGGDLGFFSKGDLEPVLEAAIEALKPGEVSPDIETTRGIHIIKLIEVEKAPAKPLDEVEETIRNMLYKREVDFRYREWLSALRERSYVRIVY